MSELLYKKNRIFYLLLILPSFLVYAFAVVGPLIFGTLPSSFFDWNLMKGTRDWTGLANYVQLFKDTNFLNAIRFTVLLGISTVVGANVWAFAVAFFLNEKVFARGLSRSLFFIPNIISGIMVSFVWIFIFTGAFPALAERFGWNWLANISWFGDPVYAFFTIFLVSIWQGSGLPVLLYITGLQSIPLDVLEAAKIDGCTGLSKVFRIQVPLLMPSVTINVFISIAGAFKTFDIPLALTAGGPSFTTQSVAMNIYQDAFATFKMGYGSAKSVILFLMVAVATIIQLSVTRKMEVQA